MFKRKKLPEPNITDYKVDTRSPGEILAGYNPHDRIREYDKWRAKEIEEIKRIQQENDLKRKQYIVEMEKQRASPNYDLILMQAMKEFGEKNPMSGLWEVKAEVTWDAAKQGQRPICHDDCHWAEKVVHPTSHHTYGVCDCGQYWMVAGGDRKAIIRLKYQAVSEEIEAAEEVLRIERAKQAENILGPDIADNMIVVPKASSKVIVPVSQWEVSPIAGGRVVPEISMDPKKNWHWPGTVNIKPYEQAAQTYYMPWDSDFVAGFQEATPFVTLEECLTVMGFQHKWFDNEIDARYVMTWVSPWEWAASAANGTPPNRYYAKFTPEQAAKLWSLA